MRVQRVFLLVLGVLLATAPAVGASKPVAVSPGDPARFVRVGDSCPTFSWGGTGQADAYELAIYRLVEENEKPRPVLRERIVGSASSWTPSLARCLGPGGHYVWFVRAVHDGEENSRWSDGRYFATPAGPTVEDVRRALEVLEAWSRNGGEAMNPSEVVGPAGSVPEGAPALPAAAATARSASTAVAAIRAEQSDPTGETYGAVGISSSPEGAGMAAVSTVGGVDFVLDGAEDGLADTLVTESGIDRPADADQTFTFRNSGAGDLAIEVDGPLTASIFRGDGSNLSNVVAATAADADMLDGRDAPFFLDVSNMSAGALAYDRFSAYGDLEEERYLDDDHDDDLVTRRQADGRFVNVTGDTMTGRLTVDAAGVGLVAQAGAAERDVVKLEVRDPQGRVVYSVDSEGDVAGQSFTGDGTGLTNVRGSDLVCSGCVGTTDIATGGVTSSDIATGAVEQAGLAAGAVVKDKIADGAVSSGKIANGAVTNDKLGHDAVTGDKIGDGEVAAVDLAAAAVGSTALADLSVTTTKLAADAVTSAKIADAAVDTEHLAAGAVTGAVISPQSVLGLHIADNAVSSNKINDLAILSADLGVGSVTSAKLASDAVTAAKIAEGVLTAAHVDSTGGIYASKSSVYVVEESVTLGPDVNSVVSASCSDENDLPISFSCNSGHLSSLDFDMTYIESWDDPTQAAKATCRFANLSDTFSRTVRAYIACLSVPGP